MDDNSAMRRIMKRSVNYHCRRIVTWHLRTTVPLVSYIRNSLRFWYYASLVPVVKILKKRLGSPGKFGRKRDQTFEGSDLEKCQF